MSSTVGKQRVSNDCSGVLNNLRLVKQKTETPSVNICKKHYKDIMLIQINLLILTKKEILGLKVKFKLPL